GGAESGRGEGGGKVDEETDREEKGRTKGGERKTGDAASPETKPETEAESLEAKAKPEDRWHSAQSLNASLGSTLSRVELMVASGSDWVWARRLMASLFWLSWISLVSGALLVIVRSPECNPPPGSTGGTTGPCIRSLPAPSRTQTHQLHHIKMLHMRAIIIGPIHQYKPDDRNKTNLKSIDMIYGNIQNFRYLIKSCYISLNVLIDLTPNPLGTKLNKWFNTTFDFEEQNKILFWLRTGVDGIFISLSTDDIETSMVRMYSMEIKRVTIQVMSLLLGGRNISPTNYRQFTLQFSENLGKLIALIMFTLPGTPIIYYGDEIGLEDYQVITTLPTLMLWLIKTIPNTTNHLHFDNKKNLIKLFLKCFHGKVLNETTYFAYTRQWNAHGILAVLNFGDTIHVDFTLVPSTDTENLTNQGPSAPI
uniref:4F2 cell-surface antigen heavy chain-like n=1 Tax=Callorhinchus milii TaxID=7868 RepID=A0A4W3H255_CALMI